MRTTWLFSLAIALLALPAPALAEPQHHEIGMFITSVHDLNVQNQTAAVEMWLWSVSKHKRDNPGRRHRRVSERQQR